LKRTWYLNAFLAAVALIGIVFYIKNTIGSLGNTKFDDAFMFTRYAELWLSGQGFSWNAVDGPAYGITSPVYLFIITATLWLTECSDALALTATSWAAGLLSIALLVVLGFVVQTGTTSRKSLVPLLVAPALLFMSPFYLHSLTGMETTFSLLSNSLLACAAVLASRRRTTAMLLLCALSGFLAYETRPDNGLYALLLPPLYFIATDKSISRYSIQYIALVSVLMACSLVVNKYLFGDYLPLPFFAKANGFYQGYIGAGQWNAMEAMLTFGFASLPFLLVIVAMATKRTLPLLAAIGFVIVATFAYYATVTQIMGWHARYYYPSIAFVVLAAYIAAFSRADGHSIPTTNNLLSRVSYGNLMIRIFIGLLVVVTVWPGPIQKLAINLWEESVIGKTIAVKPITQYRVLAARPLPQLGWWQGTERMGDVFSQLPQGTIVAASEYGFLASKFPDRTIIDLVGLHDRVIAHQGFSAEYVISRKPDLIWFPHGDYTQIVASLLDSSSFQHEYEFYPGAYNYGIALRRNSERYLNIKEKIRRDFLRTYPWYNMADYVAVPVTRSTAR
jgi:hypothetical protein